MFKHLVINLPRNALPRVTENEDLQLTSHDRRLRQLVVEEEPVHENVLNGDKPEEREAEEERDEATERHFPAGGTGQERGGWRSGVLVFYRDGRIEEGRGGEEVNERM